MILMILTMILIMILIMYDSYGYFYGYSYDEGLWGSWEPLFRNRMEGLLCRGPLLLCQQQPLGVTFYILKGYLRTQ